MRLILALFCLLMFAALTSAEGAWTLWMIGASSPWDSVGTFSTRELCAEALHQQSSGGREAGAQGHRRRAGWVVRRNGCWPGHSRAVPPRHRRPARTQGEVTGARRTQGSDTVACKGGGSMATTSAERKAVLEVRVTKPNGEKWHHASLYVPQFEATATFRAIVKKIKKDYPDINQ